MLATLIAIVGALVLLVQGSARAQSARPLRIALIGDMGYSEDNAPVAHERQYAAVLAELGREDLDLVIHAGDLGHPRDVCGDQWLGVRYQQLQALPHPVVYTPGDNEWTDCGLLARQSRLPRLRALFFATDRSLGRRTIALERQSDVDPDHREYPENARWHAGGVTFFTLHVVGSNNNFRTPEHAARDAANLAWLTSGFATARERGSRGVMIVMHAGLWPANPGITDAFQAAFLREVVAFGRPVVFGHGDTHRFKIDKPLIGLDGARVANFTRVETFGTPDHHWVEVTIAADDPAVFALRPRYVEANR